MILKIKLKLILKCYEKNYEIVKKLKKPKNAVLEKKKYFKNNVAKQTWNCSFYHFSEKKCTLSRIPFFLLGT